MTQLDPSQSHSHHEGITLEALNAVPSLTILQKEKAEIPSMTTQTAYTFNTDQNQLDTVYSSYVESLNVYSDQTQWAVHLGDLYTNRHRVMMKIGHGSYSPSGLLWIWLSSK